MTTRAAAPSEIFDALPAVTRPSFLKADRSLPSVSIGVGRGVSSREKASGSPLRCGISTVKVSSSKRPESRASMALT